jgi:hypothetical protein
MCSITCRKSTSKRCKCECGGLFHGELSLSAEEKVKHLNTTFPPCTPVRFFRPTKRGTLEGKVKNFYLSEPYLRPRIFLLSGEIVDMSAVDTIGEKIENDNRRRN